MRLTVSEIVGACVLGVVLGKFCSVDDTVEAVGSGSVGARDYRPVGRCAGADGSGTEVKTSVGDFERNGLEIGVGAREFLVGFLFVLLSCGVAAFDVFEFFEVDVVEERVARGQTVGVVRAVLTEGKTERKRGVLGGCAFEIDFVSLPHALGVDAREFGIAFRTDVNACAGDVSVFVGARNVVGEHVNGEFVVRTFFEGEVLGSVAVSGGAVILVVGDFVLGGHISHQHVVDRAFFGGEVRFELVVKDKTVRVCGAVVVPEFAVGFVDCLFEAYCAADDITGNGGRGIMFAARPTGYGTGPVAARGNDLEVGVAYQQTFGGFDGGRIAVTRTVGIASNEHSRGECDDKTQNQS